MKRLPIIWIIGATRSSKSYLAKGLCENGRARLGCHQISTSDYFREGFKEPDTNSRTFVFNLSAFSADCLKNNPNCNLDILKDIIAREDRMCVIEGERNPFEFAHLYNPHTDMVFLLKRSDMEVYNTTIEPGIDAIEQSLLWSLTNRITPAKRVLEFRFGDDHLKLARFSEEERAMVEKKSIYLGARTETLRYPWIRPMIQIAAHMMLNEYGVQIKEAPKLKEPPITVLRRP